MELLLPALAIGLVTGLLLGLVGGGGSILTVPALVYVLGVGIGPATTISLVVVGANAAYGTIRQWRKNRPNLKITCALALASTGLAGAQLGNWLNRTIPDRLLLGGFAILMLLVAWLMLRPPKLRTLKAEPVPLRKRWPQVGLIGLGLGFLTGLFGVGGGFLIVPALVLLLGFPMRQATATSLLVITLNSSSALLGRFPFPGFEPVLALVLILAGFAGTTLGAKLADRMPDKELRIAFAWLVIGLGIYIAFRALV
jgi:uncharacterized membrane protein YfcA